MIERRPAHICLLAAVICVANRAGAGVWGSQPVVGMSGDYASNPGLLSQSNTAEEHGAILLDAPTSYVSDGSKLTILPSFRFSDTRGYSSLDSDYEHFNVTEELDSERNTFTATGGVSRDSSLYYDFILNGATGVERNSMVVDLNWDHKFTERLDFEGDLNSSRVKYTEGVGVETLTDYRYTSFVPSMIWNQSERGKLSVSGTVGRYNSLDGTTKSTSANVQVGFTEQLSEIYSISASGGYSRAVNEDNTDQLVIVSVPGGFELVSVPVQFRSTQTGSVFTANVARQLSLLYLAASASRQLAPSGFAFLSRQDTYEFKANYPGSARWSFGADLRRVSYQQPVFSGPVSTVTVSSLGLSATWQWTEHWTIAMNSTTILERYGSPAVKVDSNGVGIEVARHFDWKQL